MYADEVILILKHTHIYATIYMCVYVCVCVCMCLRVCVHVYVRMCVYIHIQIHVCECVSHINPSSAPCPLRWPTLSIDINIFNSLFSLTFIY